MDVNAWLTLLAVFISPIVAVAITLWVEGRRRERDGRMLVLKTLMATRHLPGDPNYSTAVNLVPVEFNSDPSVMNAYREYLEAIRQAPSDKAEVQERSLQILLSKQTKMISAIMRALNLKASEADLPIEAYAAGGMIARDNLYLESLRAQPRIAAALERSLEQ